jgi:hypothetical protein
MPDSVATLSTTLQGQISSGGPTAGTMSALYQALMTGIGAMIASRTSRRIGLLNIAAGGQWNSYIDSNVGAVSQNFSEIKECLNLQGNLQSFSGNIARLNDSLALVNMSGATSLGYANALVAFAASYEAMELETLPA